MTALDLQVLLWQTRTRCPLVPPCSVAFEFKWPWVSGHSHQRPMHAQMPLHLLPCTQRAGNGTRASHTGLSLALPGISCAYKYWVCACCEMQDVVKYTMATPHVSKTNQSLAVLRMKDH